MQHFALKMFLRCFLEMTFNSSLTILKRQIKSHKCQETQTNCKKRTSKEVLVAAERTDPRTSVTKGPFIPNTNWLNRGEKSKNFKSPLHKKKEGGQELNENVNELTNIGILMAVFRERNITFN